MHITKPAILITVALALAGCGQVDRYAAAATGYARSCIDGVEYFQFTSGATVAYDREGKVKHCGPAAVGEAKQGPAAFSEATQSWSPRARDGTR